MTDGWMQVNRTGPWSADPDAVDAHTAGVVGRGQGLAVHRKTGSFAAFEMSRAASCRCRAPLNIRPSGLLSVPPGWQARQTVDRASVLRSSSLDKIDRGVKLAWSSCNMCHQLTLIALLGDPVHLSIDQAIAIPTQTFASPATRLAEQDVAVNSGSFRQS